MNIAELKKLRPIVKSFAANVQQNWNILDDQETQDRYHELYDLVKDASQEPNFEKYVQPLGFWRVGPNSHQLLWRQHAIKIMGSSAQLVAYLESLFAGENQTPSNTPAGHSNKLRILFLAANPRNTQRLGLDEEIREISGKIQVSIYRESLELISDWAVRPDDLLQCLNQHRPHIVHFSGHGALTGEILLVDNAGAIKPVSPNAIRALFRTLRGNIRLVFMNACYSVKQAEAIVEEIDCTVGMNTSIDDTAAIVFAASFYRALGYGMSLKNAFEQGKTALLLEGSSSDNIPILLSRQGIDPDQVFLLKSGGEMTTRQFVQEKFLSPGQLAFFLKEIGLPDNRANRFADVQFEEYCRIWKILQAVRLAGDDLWEKCTKENLGVFGERLRQALYAIGNAAIFFDESDYEYLRELLQSFGRFRVGKKRLLKIRSAEEFGSAARHMDDFEVRVQISENHKYKVQYEELLDKIRTSFNKRLSN